ncbi:YegP family protein [Arthrobacter sp. QXT-31]|uniref:YegP family protein n=1 Tax=Arthrobacter sp. QXT-31 TaxID=1357915 RepID=UPI001F3D41C4|nr:YegP family protein [Arthrobacter sp. QXT-31]
MSGYFELVDAPDGGYRIRLLDGTGALMAVSVTFPTKRAAVAGIAQAREIAGTGLIRDLCKDAVKRPAQKRHMKPSRQALKSAVSAGHSSPLAPPSQRKVSLQGNAAPQGKVSPPGKVSPQGKAMPQRVPAPMLAER